jgi:hypothetical protein
VFGVLKIKVLLFGMLLAIPPLAAWLTRSHETGRQGAPESAVTPVAFAEPSGRVAKIPVEVVVPGKGTETVYVSMPVQAVPEPGLLPLGMVSALLFMRRKRAAGK